MRVGIRFFIGTTIALGLVTIVLTHVLMSRVATAQSGEVTVTHMAGDAGGVWLATDDERLVYCWFPRDPMRREEPANCRIIDRFRATIIR